MFIFVEIKVKNRINLKRDTHIYNEYLLNRFEDIYVRGKRKKIRTPSFFRQKERNLNCL